MSSDSRPSDVPPIIGRKLQQFRRQVRAVVWLEGVAALVVLLCGAFWIGLAVDWWLEPPPAVRLAALVLLAAAAGGLFYRRLLRRAFAPLADVSLAVLLERKFQRLQDHLLTVVDLTTRGTARSYHPDLVARTQWAAAEAVAGVRTWELLRPAPLFRAVALAVMLLVSIPIFGVAATDAFRFWLQRVALSAEPWPRRVQLEVVGFPADERGQRTHKIAQGDSFELIVHADAAEHVVPREVELRFRLADGRRGRDTMIRVGEVGREAGPRQGTETEPGGGTPRLAGRGRVQVFRYEFKQVAADMTLDVVGGDDRVRDLHLVIVDRPELVALEIDCRYPDYLQRPRRRLPITGGLRIPEGTRLSIHATATKPLEEVQVLSTRGAELLPLDRTQRHSGAITWDYGVLWADDVLSIKITDLDGIASREPYRVSLAAIPDELPQLAVRLVGIGSAITPDAVLPLAGRVSDDYGLVRAWFAYGVDGQLGSERPFRRQPAGQTQSTELDAFDTREVDPSTGKRALELRPGQTFSLALRATDACNLRDGPRVGSSQQFAIAVVTESQLLAMLEQRELELRQRFEAIYAKTTDTRNLLGRIDFRDAHSGPSNLEAGNDDEVGASAADDASMAAPAQRAAARRRLRVAGALQNVTQSAHEVLGVAEGFDDVHDQLENNRVDNVDLKSRLREQIAQPLRRLAEIRMTELESQLQLIEKSLSDSQVAAAALADSVRLADEILLEMQQVLDRMLELESYNEVVALLRGILHDQRDLNDRTKQQRADRLQSLLDD